LLAENDAMAGLSVQFNPYDAVRIDFENSMLRDCAREDSFFPPLYLQGLSNETRPVGNIHFKNVTVKDDRDRPILKIRNGKNGITDITGAIMLDRMGRRETISIDQTWLESMSE
jgi:hypothetical protein